MFFIDHAMTCTHGSVTITINNDIHDITVNWLSKVCKNVEKDYFSLHIMSGTLISEKKNTVYSKTMAWIQYTLSFLLRRSVVMCIQELSG